MVRGQVEIRIGRRRGGWAGLSTACLALLVAGSVGAQVTRFEVLSVEHNAFGGGSFGDVGTYDRIKARATVAVDPVDHRNAVIADIAMAPRNAAGKVEVVSDVEILKPSDPKRGNGALFYEAPNRGNKLSFGIFNDASSNAVTTAADAGNGFLLRQGYTLVWSGWQGDLKSAPGTLALSVPTLTGVTGRITVELVFDNATNPVVAPLAWPAAEQDSAKLVVRAHWDDPPATPADMTFTFQDPSHVQITRPSGFDNGALYQLDYLARDPKVLGLGFAATRDIVTYLRRDVSPDNPLTQGGRPFIRRAYAHGQSQAGRFLREFLYLGLNEDSAHRLVFDGMLVHIGGGRFTAVDTRFGIPESAPNHPQDPGAVVNRFPFTYGETTNPFTGARDALLRRCTQSHTCPKIIQVDSEYEWYHSQETLLINDPAGKPLKFPSNVRLFTIAGAPHIVLPRAPLCVMPVNPVRHNPVLRAMLSNLDGWVDRGVTPPPSSTPNLADGSLIEADQAAGQLKTAIPGLPYSGLHVPAAAEDLTVHPPKIIGGFKFYLPRLNADGMMLGGVRLPVIDVPKATYTGWNPHVIGDGPTTLCNLVGGVVPFAATTKERMANGDPRLSVEERYASASEYVAKVDQAAKALVQQRLMLAEDLPRQHQAAADDTLAGLSVPKATGQ